MKDEITFNGEAMTVAELNSRLGTMVFRLPKRFHRVAIHSSGNSGPLVYVVIDCMRCGNPLLAKEIKAKQHHCEPCKRLVEAAAHQEKVSSDIHRANSRGGL